jgi:DNA polymerase-3 subunit beta
MNISQAITTAASAAQGKSTLPILSTLAIKSEFGKIVFTGTDLETAIKTTAQYEAPDFACCVDAKRLVAAINIIENPKIKLTDTHLIIQQGSMRFTLPFMHYDNFPDVFIANDEGIELDGSVVNLLAQVRYAQAKNDVRYYLNGVYLHSENGKLIICASDGHRIAIRYQPCKEAFNIILPTKSVNQIIKHEPEKLIISSKLRCIKDDFEMICTPIEAKYPDFVRALGQMDDTISFSKQDVQVTLSAITSLRDVSPHMGVRLEWADAELSFSSHGNDNSDVENKIPAIFDKSKKNEIAINARYLGDLVSAIDNETIELEFCDATRPLISRRNDALDLIMPMRL